MRIKEWFETSVKWLATVGVLGLIVGSEALAAPRAESAQECGVAADMAIVARSLAQEEVQRPKAGAIMSRIYEVGASERGKELMQQILDVAYIKKEKGASQNFAQELYVTCISNDGDMDTVLGRSA